MRTGEHNKEPAIAAQVRPGLPSRAISHDPLVANPVNPTSAIVQTEDRERESSRKGCRST